MVDTPGKPYDGVTDVVDLSGNGKGVALNVWPSDNRVPTATDPTPLDTFVLEEGELAYALTSQRLRVGDGYTPGGDEVAFTSDFYELRDIFYAIRDAIMLALNTKGNLDGGNTWNGDQIFNGNISTSGDATIGDDLTVNGDATFNGAVSFAQPVSVPDEIYGPLWDGKTEVPTKNAVYDKVQSLGILDINGLSTALAGKVNDTGDTMTGVLYVTGTGNANGVISMAPSGSGAYSELQMMGAGGSQALGLKVSVGNSTAYLNTDNYVFRSSASVIWLTLGASNMTLSVPVVVPDDAYAAGWNGSFQVPTKNAVYDKIESVIASVPTVARSIVGITGTLAEFNTALTDDNFAGLAAANVFTANQTISSASPTVTFNPVSGASRIDMRGTASTNDGMSLVSAPASGSLLADTLNIKNRANAATYGVFSSTGLAVTGNVSVTNEAYGPTWDGSVNVPTKDAVYDKIQSLGSVSVSDEVYGGTWNGVTTAAPSKNAVYDKIEAMSVGGSGVTTFNTRSGAVTLTTADVTTAMPAFTGDVTNPAGAVANTIVAGAVTLAKQANVASGTVFYRKTAGSGPPEVNTLATLKTDMGLDGIPSGTLAQFDTALTDHNFAVVGRDNNFTTSQSFNAASVQVTLNPSSGSSVLEMMGAAGTQAMRLQGVTGNGYVRADAINLTDKTGTNTFGVFNTSGLNLTGVITTSGGAALNGAVTCSSTLTIGSNFIQTGANTTMLIGTGPIARISTTPATLTLRADNHHWEKETGGATMMDLTSAGLAVVGTITSNGSTVALVSQLASYLPLTGGTLSGYIVTSGTQPIVAGGMLVTRGDGVEGGQIVLGYKDATAITWAGNSTWNIDVTSTNNLRIYRINAAGAALEPLTISEAGGIVSMTEIYATGNVTIAGTAYLQGLAPTQWWWDTDDRTFAIHVNSGAMYFMRGEVNSPSWTALANGQWPMQMNLLSGDTTWGGLMTAYGRITSFDAVRCAASTAGWGYTELKPGGSNVAGHIAFHYAGGARAGYMGNCTTNNFDIAAEGGRNISYNAVAHVFYNSGGTVMGSFGMDNSVPKLNVGGGRALYHGTSSATFPGGKVTTSASAPSGGEDGDIWLQYV